MKKIEAIIKPFKLDEVKASLGAVDATGLTIAEVTNCGLQPGVAYRSLTSTPDTDPKVKIEVIIDDARAELVAQAIERAARTGRDSDGTIAILHVDEAVRIRTGERGASAI
jgi:nitrogen regulatory protein P-II 1